MVESQFTISMFVSDHTQSDNPAGLYQIHPLSPTPVDYHGFFLPEDGLPIALPLHLKHHMLPSAPMFKLGSVIYFFGGRTHAPFSAAFDFTPWNEDVPLEEQLHVCAFDTDDPDSGFFSVAPLNFPKEIPCIFAARGKLYALGSNLTIYPSNTTETYTGHFERYDPELNKWEILPDPPNPFRSFKHYNMAAFKPILIYPLVFMKDDEDDTVICFNLDTEKWVSLASEKVLPPDWALNLYPFKPVYCDGHLYSIQIEPQSDFDPARPFPFRIVSGPAKECDRLKCPRVVATIEQVDGHKAVYNSKYARPRRHFYHVGHKIFCYIVDSPLTFLDEPIGYHGIWIKFFKEVSVSKFQLLDSFCYRIYHPFIVESIDFCFSGSLPNAWKKGLSLNIGGPCPCSHGNEHFESKAGLKKALNVLKLMFRKKEKMQTKKKKKKILPESKKMILPESKKMIRPEPKKMILPESSKLQEEIRLLTARLSAKKRLLEESMLVESKDKQILEESY